MSKITCAQRGCTEEGSFPAPRDPRDLKSRQYFCKEHIKEFNKRWNGLEGFSTNEIYTMQDYVGTWDKPTWKMGLNSQSDTSARFQFDTADDLFNFFNARRTESAKTGASDERDMTLPPDVHEACAIFSIEPPFNNQKLKRTYLNLVKKHHPDVNQNSEEAEATLKKINVAYQILSDYLERYAA